MNRQQSRITFVSLTFAAGLVIRAVAAPRVHHHRPVSWQQSESPVIAIGVKDKFGDLQKYTAVFTVTGPDGKKHIATRKVAADSWGYAYYPDDFSPDDYLGAGSYKWQGTVNGKAVISGSFKVSTGTDGQRLTITTK